jgi:hypothetical protein
LYVGSLFEGGHVGVGLEVLEPSAHEQRIHDISLCDLWMSYGGGRDE